MIILWLDTKRQFPMMVHFSQVFKDNQMHVLFKKNLKKTLLRLNSGTPVTVHGAGRTDAGVHAYGQVIHFDLPQERDPEKLRFGLDTQCPDDIDVVSIELVSEEFHARYNKHSKTYEF